MDHQTQQIELTGGAKLLVVNLPVAVSLSFDIYVRSGHRFTKPKHHELSHLLEHLAFEGNQLYPDAAAFKAEVERDGTYFNAHTNSDYNNYEFISLPNQAERIIKLGLAQVFQPILKPKSIAHEKETVANELKGYMDNFSRLRYESAYRTLFGKQTPDFPKRIKSLDVITLADLRQFHQSQYQPQNIRFVLSGKFTTREIKAATDQINQTLSGRPTGIMSQYLPLPLAPFERSVVTRRIPIKNQVLFSLQFVRSGYDLESIPALGTLQAMYSGGFSSRMHLKSRQAGLTYALQSAAGTDIDHTYFEAWDQTDPTKLRPLLQLAVNELADLATGNFSDEELQRAIGFKTGGLRRSYQTPSSYAGWYGSDFIYDLPLVSPEQWIGQLLQVDRAAIAAVAKHYLTRDNWALIVLGQKLDGTSDEFTRMIDQAFS